MRPTLTQFSLEHLSGHPDQYDLALAINDLATIGKILSNKIQHAALADILGETGDQNVHGDEVKQLDVYANTLCKTYLRRTGHFAALASEEEEHVVDMGEYGETANYVIAFDPLDGSSNSDVNIPVGTIFSVYKRLPDIERTSPKQFLRKGTEQVLAGYLLYGSSTVLVFSIGDGVHEFTLDKGSGSFFLSQKHVTIPEKCKNFSTNTSYTKYIHSSDQEYLWHVRDVVGAKDRHIGSLIADIHRNLMQGGVYMYFANKKNESGVYTPKLRMVYELQPCAFLVEQAGGLATDGHQSLLEKVPSELHERSVVVIGNKEVVQKYSR